jgi:GrpB-like predicted nucleotidyltransferase (UPF0157 family)
VALDRERHASLADRFDPAIRIVDYDPHWPQAFQREAREIRSALADLAVRIEHVGSTAVPGLPGKPVIDIQVSVGKIEPREAYVRPLERLGYLFAYDPTSPAYHFFAKPAQRPRRYHVHVCKADSADELRHAGVRDYLRARPDEAERYAALKRDLVTLFQTTASRTSRGKRRLWTRWRSGP